MTKQSEAVPAKPNQPKFEDNYSEAAYFAGITITQAIQCDLALRDLRAGVPLPWHTVHANPNVERKMADPRTTGGVSMSQAIHNGKKGEPLCGRAPSWARMAKRGETITCKWCIKKAKKVSK